MKKIFRIVLALCGVFLISSCSPWVDNFEGTSIDYYLQNDTKRTLYYELEGVQPSRESNGMVVIGKREQIGWTTQFEVTGPPFSKIKVYDNDNRDLLLFENNVYYSEPGIWNVERIEKNRLVQILILDDEKI